MRREQLKANFRSGGGETEEDDEEGEQPALKRPAGRAKAAAKAKGKAKAAAKAKSGKAKAKPKASPKKRSTKASNGKKTQDGTPIKKVKRESKKVKPDGTPGKKVKRTGISKKTFAGRYVKGPELLAMRDVFEEKIYFKLRSHSSLQDSFFKMVTSAFSTARAEQKELDYTMCVEIVNEHVEEFLKLDDVRPSTQQLSLKKPNAFQFFV